MVIDLHAQNQVNICKRLGKKSGKLILRTDRRMDRWTDRLMDGQTDRRTECKPKVPFGFAGSGLKRRNCLLQVIPPFLTMFSTAIYL